MQKVINSAIFKDLIPYALELLSHCTVAGLKNLGRAKTASEKRFWTILILFASVCCACLCYKGLSEYLSYAVRTNVALNEPVRNLPIPSLVFCPRTTIKNSVYYADAMAREFYLKLLTLYVPDKDNLTHWKRMFTYYCQIPPKEDSATPIDLAGLMNSEDVYKRLIDIIRQIMTSRSDILLRCFYGGTDFACNSQTEPSMATDIYTDDAMCFRFNFKSKSTSNRSINLKKSIMSARSHDLTLVMDSKQNQRCGHAIPVRGEGFLVWAIDRKTLIERDGQRRRYSVHPGYEYVAKIKMIKTMRNTEHLGRCRSKGYHSTNQSLPPLEYSKNLCQGILLLQNLYQKCGCIPPMENLMYPYLNKENVGMEMDFENLCSRSLSLMNCLLDTIESASLVSFISMDSACLHACVELNPDISILVKRKLTIEYLENFNISFAQIVKQTNYSTVENLIRKNMLVFHVDFETTKVDLKTEIQVFTFIDLLRYLASTMSLFFGISCVSFFEAIFLVIRLIIRSVKFN